jgi:hypothetical protein
LYGSEMLSADARRRLPPKDAKNRRNCCFHPGTLPKNHLRYQKKLATSHYSAKCVLARA